MKGHQNGSRAARPPSVTDFWRDAGLGIRILGLALVMMIASQATAQDAANKEAWKIPDAQEKFHVFLLMGQSNMSGFGKVLAEDREPVPRVVKLPTKGKQTWQPAAHPLHNRLKSDRFGLGLPFASAYLKEHPGVTVGLIPVAWGGAGIDKLKKGTPTYKDAMKKAQQAMTQGTIKGVLWHQGESDTVAEAKANAYEEKLHQLIADVRADLGDKSLPFIVGNLAEFYGTGKDHRQPDRVKRINQVRGVLRALPAKVAHTGFVESTDCSSPDRHQVHFDRRSYVILGERYAAVYAKLTAQGER